MERKNDEQRHERLYLQFEQCLFIVATEQKRMEWASVVSEVQKMLFANVDSFDLGQLAKVAFVERIERQRSNRLTTCTCLTCTIDVLTASKGPTGDVGEIRCVLPAKSIECVNTILLQLDFNRRMNHLAKDHSNA